MYLSKLNLLGFICLGTTIIAAPDFLPFSNPPVNNKTGIFAPGKISDQFGNRDMAISPDGKEMFWTLQQGPQLSFILHSRELNGKWTEPEIASFSGRWMDLEPAFSPEGNQLYFVSKRPVEADQQKRDFDIWVINKVSGKWSEPIHLPAPLNTKENEFYPSLNRAGDIFFTRDVGAAKEDILVSRKSGSDYREPVSLPAAVNSNGFEFNAFVDPEEKYILFTGFGRADDLGGGDLYISKKAADGSWQDAVNLGPEINSPFLDYCPFVSPDKKYFFFASNRTQLKQPFKTNMSLEEVKSSLENNNNGYDDIYWTNYSVIEKR